jgi:uncharacterized protein (DUF697 family)
MYPELHAKLDEAAKRAESRNDKAELIICANVLFNAGMGVVPFGIDMWLFVGANVAAIIALGYLYGFTKNREQRKTLIKQIFSAGCITYAASFLGIRLFSEALQGEGLFDLGGPMIIGMALDVILSGAVSYAVGYTAKVYFFRGCTLEKAEMRKEFHPRIECFERFEEGKTKFAPARKAKETPS